MCYYFNCSKLVDDSVAIFKSFDSNQDDSLHTLIIAGELHLDSWIDAIIQKFKALLIPTETTDNSKQNQSNISKLYTNQSLVH